MASSAITPTDLITSRVDKSDSQYTTECLQAPLPVIYLDKGVYYPESFTDPVAICSARRDLENRMVRT